MHEQRQERRAEDDAGGMHADGPQDAIDDGVKQPGVGHDAEIEDGEHEHRGDRCGLLNAGDDELCGIEAEPADERRRCRHRDEGHERRQAAAHDEGEERQYRQQAKGGKHAPFSRPMERKVN